MKKKRLTALLAAALLTVAPLWAVFKETNLPKTLRVLNFELVNTYDNLRKSSQGLAAYEKAQQQTLVELMEECNELSLMLYSQKQDFTFDLTYALDAVTRQYLDFNSSHVPYDEIVRNLEIEIDRYDKLVQTLKNLPPAIAKGVSPATEETREDVEYLESVVSGQEEDAGVTFTADSSDLIPPADSVFVNDSILLSVPSFMDSAQNPYLLDAHGQADRDSCLRYAELILDEYWERLFLIDENNSYYLEANEHLKEAYNYAQQRYAQVQKNIFISGQSNYLNILRHFPFFFGRAVQDCHDKYGTSSPGNSITSEWRGPMVLGFLGTVVMYIILAIGLSLLLVRILVKKVRFFSTEEFLHNKFLFTVFTGIVIFAISVMFVNLFTDSNFIRMAMPLVAEFAWLGAAIFASVLIRMSGKRSRHAIGAYMPVLTLGFIIIAFRIIFIPNSLINIVFPPLLIGMAVWQSIVNGKWSKDLPASDKTILWVSMVAISIAAIISCIGYVMIALLVAIWWIFQLTLIQTIMAVSDLLDDFNEKHLKVRKKQYMQANPNMPFNGKSSFIEVTWIFDMVKNAIIPILSVWTIPLCIFMAGDVFDLSSVAKDWFYRPIINVENVINLSLLKVVVVISMGYAFNYICYAVKSFYRLFKTRAAVSKLGEGVAFKETNINFTLADNVISLLSWGSFIIISFIMLQIPATAITVITTGLATGMGFAMKDVLNNFFYGMQLMSGRLRVGDVIECDGIRGTVDSMSYQSTQILASDGSIIAFPNSSLFSKNFKNLTRNNYYQLLTFPVGVKYGSDVAQVRKVIIDALQALRTKDKYGRDTVDPKFGIEVRFEGFGDNSVDLKVLQKVTVDTYYTYAAKAKELIYNALNENGIEIPFPQRDLYLKSVPQDLKN